MTDNKNNKVSLPLHLDLKTVTETHKHIIDLLDEGNQVDVDVTDLQGIDTAGIQLLVCVSNYGKSKSGSVSLTGNSSVVNDRARSLGLEGFN